MRGGARRKVSRVSGVRGRANRKVRGEGDSVGEGEAGSEG